MQLPSDQRMLLRAAVEKAIYESVNQKSASEPNIIAGLVRNLPEAINSQQWGKRGSIKAGGVFIHNRPKVMCKNDPSGACVELGDLLLLQTTRNKKQKVISQKGMLLQAKMVAPRDLYAGFKRVDNEKQLTLYATWPKFMYEKSGSLNGQERQLVGVDLCCAAQYLLLVKDYERFCPIAKICGCDPRKTLDCCCDVKPPYLTGVFALPTSPFLSHFSPWVKQLMAFIQGFAGKGYSPPASDDIGWNRVIKDLVEETAICCSVHMGNGQRASGLLCCFASGNINALENLKNESFIKLSGEGGKELPPWESWRDEFPGGGISMLEFIYERGEE